MYARKRTKKGRGAARRSAKSPPGKSKGGQLFPLLREETLMDKADTVCFTVYLDATSTDDKVKLYVPVYRDGTIEDWLEWREAFANLQEQKKLTTGEKLFRTARVLLAGDALKSFDQLVQRHCVTTTVLEATADTEEV